MKLLGNIFPPQAAGVTATVDAQSLNVRSENNAESDIRRDEFEEHGTVCSVEAKI
jgi:hypothetical protein